ncbi:ArsC/Spx/MgsR family protein [Undibacterium oligocarboniphilum]|uniref:Arsenate reductase (Glutaredoxin) n=1 Tax=Undibacterium oligocarboniphilum TaxID=666702 RepID=A0A850QFQ3_9BURK|nr:ArsC/Spx/MgsR family protein [Undibacterium oligocarboniphilum]MBC3869640.1 arsenate reductase (glutaredoxin) [Undibacterium oligocarboniphilum]NVO78019.1 arsenate reductase (glutaredoxin) [Undibacterium oligocarboniphilum]
MLTIYHNPRCSKSRETLELVNAEANRRGWPVTVIDYLKQPPDLHALHQILTALGGDVQQMLRANEPEYTVANLQDADIDTALQAIMRCPALLQRPIVLMDQRAVIGRPPENVSILFQKAHHE